MSYPKKNNFNDKLEEIILLNICITYLQLVYFHFSVKYVITLSDLSFFVDHGPHILF